MRRDNRPRLPPGTLPRRTSAPPGLQHQQHNTLPLPPQNPTQPPTEAQQAAFDQHRRQARLTAYDALIASNPSPGAANIPRPSPPGLLPSSSNNSLLPPTAGVNGVASGVNSPTSPAPPPTLAEPQSSPTFSESSACSPFSRPRNSPFGISSAVPQAPRAPTGIPQADGAYPPEPIQSAVNPTATVQQAPVNQGTAPAPAESLAQAVPAPDPTGFANLSINDIAPASPAPESNNNS
ncbi:hypothetical protein ONS95_003452 [Cadophora gregata]|uniref:uncharacterized protein n=1 Tax=Cadophora gregata TaxID=51156 RepID=UPI0026DC84CC|nr:uncharacterized protein ONS95_003452 [Cadophora gregata]KAK0108660.1 hypothetical protein ONS95_003452 [Cadophora gregata]KAK0108749.1 hypothetical protein ONS96_002594 [Cadophora gregata f. sp. sojae]